MYDDKDNPSPLNTYLGIAFGIFLGVAIGCFVGAINNFNVFSQHAG